LAYSGNSVAAVKADDGALRDNADSDSDPDIPKSVVLLTGDRGFESISLQRRVSNEPRGAFAAAGRQRTSALPDPMDVAKLSAHSVREVRGLR
jgi:hypothetical protein